MHGQNLHVHALKNTLKMNYTLVTYSKLVSQVHRGKHVLIFICRNYLIEMTEKYQQVHLKIDQS